MKKIMSGCFVIVGCLAIGCSSATRRPSGNLDSLTAEELRARIGETEKRLNEIEKGKPKFDASRPISEQIDRDLWRSEFTDRESKRSRLSEDRLAPTDREVEILKNNYRAVVLNAESGRKATLQSGEVGLIHFPKAEAYQVVVCNFQKPLLQTNDRYSLSGRVLTPFSTLFSGQFPAKDGSSEVRVAFFDEEGNLREKKSTLGFRYQGDLFQFACDPTPSARAQNDGSEQTGDAEWIEIARMKSRLSELEKAEQKSESNIKRREQMDCWIQVSPASVIGTLDQAWVHTPADGTIEIKSGNWGNRRVEKAREVCEEKAKAGLCRSCAGISKNDPNFTPAN